MKTLTDEEKKQISQRANLFIQNNKAIRKFLNNLPKEDLNFFQELVEKNLDPKAKENEMRFKQICQHGLSNMNMWEKLQLIKAFKTLGHINKG